MKEIITAVLDAFMEPGIGVGIIALAAIVVAGMSVYGMIVALKSRGS